MMVKAANTAVCILMLACIGEPAFACRNQTIVAEQSDITLFLANQVARDDIGTSEMWNRAVRRSPLSSKARAKRLRDPLISAVKSLEVPDVCFSVCKGNSRTVPVLTGCSKENCAEKSAAVISTSVKAVGLRRQRGLNDVQFEFYFQRRDLQSLKLLSAWAVLVEYSVDYSKGYAVPLKVDYDTLRGSHVRAKVCAL